MSQLRTIRRPAVLAKTGLSATTVYYLEQQGKFPRHFLLTPRCAVWDESEVDAWLQSRRAAPAAAAPVPDQAMRQSRPGRGKARAA